MNFRIVPPVSKKSRARERLRGQAERSLEQQASASDATVVSPPAAAPTPAAPPAAAAVESDPDLRVVWRFAAPILVLLFALSVRFYFLFSRRVLRQPVWPDEAAYLVKARSLVFGSPSTGFAEDHALGLPLALAALYRLHIGDTGIRVAMACSGVAAAYFLYRIGERFWSEHAGFVAAILFSAYYIPLFYSLRVMTDMPHVALSVAALSLLLSQRPWAIRLVGPMLVAAIYVRPSALIVAVLIGAYVLVSEGRAAFRRRDYAWSAALGLLVAAPLLLRDFAKHADPLASLKTADYELPALRGDERWQGVVAQLQSIGDLGKLCMSLLVAGLLLSCWALRPGAARQERARSLLLLAWLVAPLACFGAFARPVDPRFVMLALPPVFLLIGSAANGGMALVSRLHAAAGPVLGALLLLGVVPHLLRGSDTAVSGRVTSHAPVRATAEWIRKHNRNEAPIWGTGQAQITLYSGRRVELLPSTREQLDAQLAAAPPSLVVLSGFDKLPGYFVDAAPAPEDLRAKRDSAAALRFLWRSKAHHQALGLKLDAAFPPDDPRVLVFKPSPAVAAAAARPVTPAPAPAH